MTTTSTLKQAAAFSVLAFFCLYFFSSGLVNSSNFTNFTVNSHSTPDFSRYKAPRTLSEDEFPINDRKRRTIILGDIHGMNQPFHALLDKISFDPSSDALVHVGDIIAKGPNSEDILSYMVAHNITGVRGNHDQKVIEWRTWLNWVTHLDGGKHFLNNFHRKAEAADPDDPEHWAEKHIKKTSETNSKWWKLIPEGWKILSDHYRLARAMSDAEYQYLLSLPLVLHAPSAHTFIAHAGVLPSDPRYAPSHRRQPLARVPVLPDGLNQAEHPEKTLALLRRLQEAAILTEVPQNTDPWVNLNMRSILKDNSITRSKHGEPWANLWNRDMSLCAGFDGHLTRSSKTKTPLSCYPATVVYGHAAARGLDIKRWSVGLDSGCVAKGRLSALVLGPNIPKSHSGRLESIVGDIEARKKTTIPFGAGEARIVDVSCK
ncbi:phosphoric monoester hydrolase [Favolaschia claudopus]|uniref:Phosphoric monoester hydrolase n=1 Tax=Favolaschia claudopus TaxID=2862362 RepID=A0AAW0C245_9AGAR